MLIYIAYTYIYICILLLVDILSRKAWAYVWTKPRKQKWADVNVASLKEFEDAVGFVKGLEGDNEFSSVAIKDYVKVIILDQIPVLRRKSIYSMEINQE